MTFATFVVTYNRKELLAENLKAQLSQTLLPNRMIIIDNGGSDGTKEYLEQQGILPNPIIDYIYLSPNIGSAGGFRKGTEAAYATGFDWIIMMDDDGKPFRSDTFALLMEKAEKVYAEGNKKALLNSLVTYDGEHLTFGIGFSEDEVKEAQKKDELLINASAAFNCTMVSREVVEAVGTPREDFYISCDEREYVKRIMDAGCFVAVAPNSIYQHPQAKDPLVEFEGGLVELFPRPVKEYYYIRNHIAMNHRSPKYAYIVYRHRRKVILALEDQKELRLKYLRRAVRDGVLGRMGKRYV